MVRLVFRPYTQVKRTICTLVSLRASTRVSPGFTLFRHRSPSFGSQQICSYSNLSQANDRSIVPPTREQDSYLSKQACLYFHCALGFSTQTLAYMLDSLVRVSRRVNENHFVKITSGAARSSFPVERFSTCIALLSSANGTPGSGICNLVVPASSSIHPTVGLPGYNRHWVAPPPYLPDSFLPRNKSILTHQIPLDPPTTLQ